MNKYKNIVVLTGAGISAESGISTFRSDNGLWENHRIEDVAMPSGYQRNPELVHRFYNMLRANLQKPEIKPNLAHIALATFEANFAGQFTLITQNIDDLHKRAGSKQVLPMHGELLKARCPHTNKVLEWKQDLTQQHYCQCCTSPQPLRPHIVWFEEMPLYMDKIDSALRQADLFVSIGTSGHVYPAAGFAQLAKQYGAKTVELNLEPSQAAHYFDEKRYGLATQLVAQFFAEIN